MEGSRSFRQKPFTASGPSAFSREGIRRIYHLKGRHGTSAGAAGPSLEAAAPLVEGIPPEALRLAEAFWPGPMTLVLPRLLWKAGDGGISHNRRASP